MPVKAPFSRAYAPEKRARKTATQKKRDLVTLVGEKHEQGPRNKNRQTDI